MQQHGPATGTTPAFKRVWTAELTIPLHPSWCYVKKILAKPTNKGNSGNKMNHKENVKCITPFMKTKYWQFKSFSFCGLFRSVGVAA